MSGRSARKQNRGNNPSLFSPQVSGKARDFHTSTSGDRYVPPWAEASGGNINGTAPGDGYYYHLFSSPGTFVIPGTKPGSVTFDVLLIGGGGSGGANDSGNGAGGGGAGGVVHHSQLDASGTLTVTVGAGGVHPTTNNQAGPVGADSTLVSPTAPWTITAKGGGGGGYYGVGGSSGGSGGGGGGYGGNYSNAHATGVQPTQNPAFSPDPNFNQYGNDGGAPSDSNPGNAGGGGGAQSVGGSNPAAEGAPGGVSSGGNGEPFPGFPGALPGFTPMPAAWIGAVGPTGHYGGGGAGANPYSGVHAAAGGPGGGGSGASPMAIANTGGGGGGNDPASVAAGNGGAGICIIKYQG